MSGILTYVLHYEGDFKAPPPKSAGEKIVDEDTDETVEKIVAWLDERKLI